MAVNIHIKIDSIDGMSQVDGFTDQIQVDSFAWGMSQTTNFSTAQGGGAGKVQVQDLTFNHLVDRASPKLMIACSTGQHLKEATLSCRKVDGNGGVDFLKITLTDVLVSSVQSSGSNGDDTPTESVSLAFAAYKVEYQEQDNSGARKGGVIDAKFSIQQNKKL